jgi:hypothetical protein
MAVAALAWVAFTYHVLLCSFPYQLCPSEAGMLQSVRALQAGWDPWSPGLAPVYANLYGIGYPSLVALLSRGAPGMDLLLLMRLVSAGATFLSLGLVYLALRGARARALPAVACCLAIYTTLLFFDAQSARPDALLVACFVLSAVWALQPGAPDAVFAGAVAGASFFVKPNGLLAPLLVAFLLLLQGRRRHAWMALASALALGAALLGLVLWRYPLYLLGTVVAQFHGRDFDWTWLLKQWGDLLLIHAPWVLALALAASRSLWRRDPLFPLGPWRLWAALSALVLLVLMAGPGAHRGAYLSYYNQMLLPFLYLAGALWLLAQGVEGRWVALALVLSAASVLHMDMACYPADTVAQTQAWAQADAWVAAHPFGYYPPLFTSLCVKDHAFVADTEHTHSLALCVWGRHSELKDAYDAHMARIAQDLQAGRFQSVVCGGNWPCPGGMEQLGYRELPPLYLRSPLTFSSFGLQGQRFSVYVPVKGPAKVAP